MTDINGCNGDDVLEQVVCCAQAVLLPGLHTRCRSMIARRTGIKTALFYASLMALSAGCFIQSASFLAGS